MILAGIGLFHKEESSCHSVETAANSSPTARASVRDAGRRSSPWKSPLPLLPPHLPRSRAAPMAQGRTPRSRVLPRSRRRPALVDSSSPALEDNSNSPLWRRAAAAVSVSAALWGRGRAAARGSPRDTPHLSGTPQPQAVHPVQRRHLVSHAHPERRGGRVGR